MKPATQWSSSPHRDPRGSRSRLGVSDSELAFPALEAQGSYCCTLGALFEDSMRLEGQSSIILPDKRLGSIPAVMVVAWSMRVPDPDASWSFYHDLQTR